MLKLKRVYDGKAADDGARIFVDRLWPRGLRSAEAGIDEWAKELAPGDELRRWFAHRPERRPEFRQSYLKELSGPQKEPLLQRLARMAAKGNVTLLYAAQDTEHNNAVVLAGLLTKVIDSLPPE